jgi:hypothetical protein
VTFIQQIKPILKNIKNTKKTKYNLGFFNILKFYFGKINHPHVGQRRQTDSGMDSHLDLLL